MIGAVGDDRTIEISVAVAKTHDQDRHAGVREQPGGVVAPELCSDRM